MSLIFSWNSDRGDSRDCDSANCCSLRCQKESQTDGECTGQLAQHAVHALTAIHAQPDEL